MTTEQLLSDVVLKLNQGAVICYPTEAVFGLGCDPDNQAAVAQLLALKSRTQGKGLILVADNYGQCLPYVDDAAIPMDKRAAIFSAWPGPITWILPASKHAPSWLTGGRSSIAIRVSAHPTVKTLCQQFGKPLVSTSANVSGQPAARTSEEAQRYFSDQVAIYLDGNVNHDATPSQIIDALSGAILRN
ncbi:L-threonylcarbamoyladenylate synthase type 1 TsaC [Pseudoalteromonas xiamenensis]|uniref:L-threonylcarbamoyladenylate synthase n=1 Tax=Pseudoalteromonas xiamenensis TaxID=882626 RepID=UPI0027E3DF28|nr:L-threonylcarbamoyladenylate synthase [Pseudoalteromonas xiamenensis]WMN58654.1 L-threonylcarbamoyladenylate synthase [Pseudoalteromonas xiamenensis]